MLRKLALAASLTFALTSPARAATRGLADRIECTHCLPSVVTGGPVGRARGKPIERTAPRTSVRTSTHRLTARKGLPQVASGRPNAVVNTECACAKGSCPSHG